MQMSGIEKPCNSYKPWKILFGVFVGVGVEVWCHLRTLKGTCKLPYCSSFTQELYTN